MFPTIALHWYTNWRCLQSGVSRCRLCFTWWRHPMETSFALLAICAGNLPVTGEFPAQRPVTQSFDVFFDLRLKKTVEKTIMRLVICDPIAPIITSIYALKHDMWQAYSDHWFILPAPVLIKREVYPMRYVHRGVVLCFTRRTPSVHLDSWDPFIHIRQVASLAFDCPSPLFDSSPPSTAYMHQWIWSALVQIMAWRRMGEPMLANCQFESWEWI